MARALHEGVPARRPQRLGDDRDRVAAPGQHGHGEVGVAQVAADEDHPLAPRQRGVEVLHAAHGELPLDARDLGAAEAQHVDEVAPVVAEGRPGQPFRARPAYRFNT